MGGFGLRVAGLAGWEKPWVVQRTATTGILSNMKTQLFFDLTAEAGRPSVHLRETEEVETIMEELLKDDVAVFEVDGAAIQSREDLFRAFAIALRKPKGWYGDEEFAPNAEAFLEYLDDVHEWVPAKRHVVLVRGSEELWRTGARLAGMLTEWWQFATLDRKARIHLLFVW